MIDTIVSLGLAPFIRAVVEFIKPAWKDRVGSFSGIVTTLASIIIGIIIAWAWQIYSGNDPIAQVVVAYGLLSGFVATIYNDHRETIE